MSAAISGVLSGSSGAAGTSGSSGTSGSNPIRITPVTLGTSGWVYSTSSAYYQYAYASTSVGTSTVVDFTPNTTSGFAAQVARIQPQIVTTAGTATLYSQYPPQADIVGEVVITTVQ